MKVTFLVNGPGELWGWARPLSREMATRGWKVTIRLLPCPFASGRELHAAERLDVVSVKGPCNWIKTILSFKDVQTDLVVQLGGDLLFGRILSAVSRAPLACYTYGDKKGIKKCDLVATAFSNMADNISVNASVMGDLVSDGVKMEEGDFYWKSKGFRVAFFPGSRPEIRRISMPYLREVVVLLKEREPDLEYATLMSPFITSDEIKLWKARGLCPVTASAGKVLKGADLAVTQPGTNTLEILHTSVPALVAVPFRFLKNIPLSGFKGIVLSMPGGEKLKDSLLRKKAENTGFLAWPNRLAGAEVMPELVGDISPEDLVDNILAMLRNRDKIKTIKDRLKRFQTSNGSPARCFCDALERLVVKKYER